MTVLFAEGLAPMFVELPKDVQRQAARSIDLLSLHPRMYPIRRRGLMRGCRLLFYYSVAADEIRLTAIIPAAMRLA